jgi:hypothetical protein
MRQVVGGGSTTSRWLSNEGWLLLREKAARAIHSSTWRIWGEPLPPPAQVCGISRTQATTAAATMINDGLEFLCFAAKTIGSAAKWWSSNGVLE